MTMHFLCPLPKTTLGIQYVVGITYSYSKMIRTFLTTKKTAAHIVSVFWENFVMVYGIPKYVLTEKEPQFVGKFFTNLYGYLEIKKLETTAYHGQT